MKKFSFLMYVLFVSMLFVSCDKDDQPAPKLTLTPSTVEVKMTENVTVKVSGGTAPYTVKEADKTIATATVTSSDIKVMGVKEGQTTVAVTDKKGVKGTITVKVIKKS
ncbi:MAG: hypothetical protein PHO94_03335 [Petrimonas sp.]|nr:hypothetical protein [Petrimonas sp.]